MRNTFIGCYCNCSICHFFLCCCPYHRGGKMWRNVHFLDWNSRLKTGIFHNLYLEFSLKFQSVSAINRYWGLNSTNRFNLFTFFPFVSYVFFLSFLPFDPFFRMLLLPSTVAVRCILNEFTSVEINTRCASGKSIVSRLFSASLHKKIKLKIVPVLNFNRIDWIRWRFQSAIRMKFIEPFRLNWSL